MKSAEMMHSTGARCRPTGLRPVFAVHGHRLFLVAQHQGHARIERQGAADHADHHRDGGDVPDLVPAHADSARRRRRFRRRPLPRNLHFTDEALGWFKGTIWPTIPFVAIIIAFGHSLLSMSGFETLAQVYREIAYPKLKNLRITGNIVCIYAVVCTGVITVFAGMIIPDAVRGKYVGKSAGRTRHVSGRTARSCAWCSTSSW